MSDSDDSLEQWQQLAAELQVYRDALQETWGDLDDVAIANYLAGNPTDTERAAVERAILDKPAVCEMIEVVREALEPIWIPEMTPTQTAGKQTVRCLKQSLQIWINDVGNVVASGIEQLRRGPQFADVALGQESTSAEKTQNAPAELQSDERIWEIPIEDPDCIITIRTKPATKSNSWLLRFEFTDDLAAENLKEARFALTNMATPELPLIESSCSRHSGSFHELKAGSWELKLEISDVVSIIPIQLGVPSKES